MKTLVRCKRGMRNTGTTTTDFDVDYDWSLSPVGLMKFESILEKYWFIETSEH